MDKKLFQVTDGDTNEVAKYNGKPAYSKGKKAAQNVRDVLNEKAGRIRYRVSRGPDHPKRKDT